MGKRIYKSSSPDNFSAHLEAYEEGLIKRRDFVRSVNLQLFAYGICGFLIAIIIAVILK